MRGPLARGKAAAREALQRLLPGLIRRLQPRTVEAVRKGGAAAVAAASLFHFRDLSPIKVKAGLKRAGLPVR